MAETVSANGDRDDSRGNDAEQSSNNPPYKGLRIYRSVSASTRREEGRLTLVFHSIKPSLTTCPDNVAVMEALCPDCRTDKILVRHRKDGAADDMDTYAK